MTDELVASTASAVLGGGLTAIICVGESAEQRADGETTTVLTHQVEMALAGVASGAEDRVLFAYEPIWAIGTGVAATEVDAQMACAHIRSVIAHERTEAIASTMRILYGGSAKPDNAGDLVGQPDVDGDVLSAIVDFLNSGQDRTQLDIIQEVKKYDRTL